MPNALPDDPLAVVQGWTVLIEELGRMDPSRGQLRFWRSSTDIEPRPLGPEQASFFQEKILPIFEGNDIAIYIARLETIYPWLHEFTDRDKGFAGTTRRLQQDPIDVPDILSAYIKLLGYAGIKRGMTVSLRYFADAVDYISEEGKCGKKKPDSYNFSDIDMDIVHSHFEHFEHFSFQRDLQPRPQSPYAENANWADLDLTVCSVRRFSDMVPPVEGVNQSESWEGWKTIIRKLRSKIAILSLGNDMRGREQLKTIEDLKKQNQAQEQEIKKYRGILSDLSYRHLMEMLPLATQAAKNTLKPSTRAMLPKTAPGAAPQGADSNDESPKKDKKKQKGKEPALKAPPPEDHRPKGTPTQHPRQKLTPQWQDFWKEAWDKASDSKSDLHPLWTKSSDIRRAQIKDEGNRIYGLLSANIHDFAALYDLKDQPKDVIREAVLLALKPKNFDAETQDVDWELEQKRFVWNS